MKDQINGWRAKVERSFATLGAYIFLIRDHNDGGAIYTHEGSLEKIEPGKAMTPTLYVPEDCLPSLFQALWDAGLRPSDRRYEAEADLLKGQLDLQGRHLEDMRTIVFKQGPKHD